MCTPRILLFRPFLDVSISYARYLAHILGSATEIIINITLVMTIGEIKINEKLD